MKRIIVPFIILLFSCTENRKLNEQHPSENLQKESKLIQGLKGNWVYHSSKGFKVVEIESHSNVTYSELVDRKAHTNVPNTERYWYYKSKATLSVTDGSRISIHTKDYVFDYKIVQDTLVEFDKMGIQAKLVRME